MPKAPWAVLFSPLSNKPPLLAVREVEGDRRRWWKGCQYTEFDIQPYRHRCHSKPDSLIYPAPIPPPLHTHPQDRFDLKFNRGVRSGGISLELLRITKQFIDYCHPERSQQLTEMLAKSNHPLGWCPL